MKTGLHQHTGLRQELRINPRLYQAMDMLYMPMMDLQQHLKQELLEPSVFARLKLEIISQLRSHAGVALYEVARQRSAVPMP